MSLMLSATKTCTLPSGGEIPDGRDIDCWENEGGRSFGTRLGSSRD